ncbi:MAG: ABC transporter permease [Caulobacteraceae bacterium]|nr:MAG: ABC transporter permease [Caulobacteraceae bacterium]
MMFAMFRVMLLRLLRDRGALAMTFLLPPLVFVIFATVFAGSSGENIKLKLVIADQARTPASGRLVEALLQDGHLRSVPADPSTIKGVRRQVREGKADAGLIILSDPAGAGTPFLIITDTTRAMAAPMTRGRIQAALSERLPDVVLSKTLSLVEPVYDPSAAQQARARAVIEGVRDDVQAGRAVPADQDQFAVEAISGAGKGRGTITYYAGAVTILFALFSAVNAAMTLIEERRAGVADRILAGAAGMTPALNGKFLFIVLQTMLQACAIFFVAQLIYDTQVRSHLWPWLATSVCVGVCAAGVALGIVSLHRNRDQAQLVSTFLILLLAAVGGSMVPRFLMPPWLQTLGLFTPHVWAIDAYQALLWRDAELTSVYPAWGILVGIGLAGLLLAHVMARLVRR